MEFLNSSSVTWQENRFKDGFLAKRKQKKPTGVGISVQDLGQSFLRNRSAARRCGRIVLRAEPLR
jgi:hypothetical protein